MAKKKPLLKDFEKNSPFPQGGYEVNWPLNMLEGCLADFEKDYDLDMDPDFQRGHVWTSNQQRLFVEYFILGGPSARVVYFACEGFSGLKKGGKLGRMSIVDGKQRLTALLAFLRNELRIFPDDRNPLGYLRSEFGDKLHLSSGKGGLRVNVADVNREQTLRWYLALNAGGTPHTVQEIERVRGLLAAEEK